MRSCTRLLQYMLCSTEVEVPIRSASATVDTLRDRICICYHARSPGTPCSWHMELHAGRCHAKRNGQTKGLRAPLRSSLRFRIVRRLRRRVVCTETCQGAAEGGGCGAVANRSRAPRSRLRHCKYDTWRTSWRCELLQACNRNLHAAAPAPARASSLQRARDRLAAICRSRGQLCGQSPRSVPRSITGGQCRGQSPRSVPRSMPQAGDRSLAELRSATVDRPAWPPRSTSSKLDMGTTVTG